MITAKHFKPAHWTFNFYLERLLKNHFYAFQLLGDSEPGFGKYPVILLTNHSSWWDGFFVYYLNRTLFGRKLYMMMLQNELENNRFFSKIGAYSIAHGTLTHLKQSLKYTCKLLSGKPENMVCIFPQGNLLPWNIRPLGFERGIEFVLNKVNTPVNVCLLGLRIESIGEQRPHVFFKFENTLYLQPGKVKTKDLEMQMEHILNNIQHHIVEQDFGLRIFNGRRSVNRVLTKKTNV